jgi:hypothetical protein
MNPVICFDLRPEFDHPFRWDLKVLPGADRIAGHEGIELFAPDREARP